MLLNKKTNYNNQEFPHAIESNIIKFNAEF